MGGWQGRARTSIRPDVLRARPPPCSRDARRPRGPGRRALALPRDGHRPGAPGRADRGHRRHVDRHDAVQPQPPRALGRGGARGDDGGRRAAPVQHDRGLRQPDAGHARDARLAGLARADRRLDRADGRGARLRRAGVHRRLRQDGAGRADGARPHRQAGARDLQRPDARGHVARRAGDDPGGVGGRRRLPRRAHRARGPGRARARGLPRARHLRRPVHGEHDGAGAGVPGHRAARPHDGAGGRPGRARRRGGALWRAGRRAPRGRPDRPGVPRPPRAGERDGGDLRHGRLDQRAHAPRRDRPRGGASSSPRTIWSRWGCARR